MRRTHGSPVRAFVVATVCLSVPLAALPCSARVEPVLHLIARSGDAFAGRDGYVYESVSPFIGAKSIDPSGDIYFPARGKDAGGGSVEDVLVYRHATRTVEPYVRTGETVDGVSAKVFWGVVGGAQTGTMSLIERLVDGTPGDAGAVVVARPGGVRTVMARQGEQAPGYALPATLTDVGLTSGAFLDVDMNSVGDVAFGARFKDAANVQRYGYYLTRADGTRERIIDSTMPIPGHAAAQWIAYDNIGAPFDIYAPGLDAAGNAYFKAKFRMNSKDYRAFYKRSADGSITPIVDTADTDAVPGLPGYTFKRLRASVNNQEGDTAFAGELSKPDATPFGAGVFAKKANGSLSKVLVYAEPVPGIPEAQNALPGLMAMSNAGHLLVTANYFLSYPTGNLGGQSLVLYNPDGSAEPVLKFNETPGFPGERAGLCNSADVNTRGDVVFITRMNITQEHWLACAYLNDTNELVPILKTGDTLLGMTVVSFTLGGGATEPQGSIGASAGPVCWDDARTCSLVVTLKDAAGVETDVFYAVQVPSPSAAAVLIPAALWRGGVWRLRRPA